MSEHMNILRSLRPLLPYIEGKKKGRPDDRLLDTPEVFIDLKIMNAEYSSLWETPLTGWTKALSVRSMVLDSRFLMPDIPEDDLATIHLLKINGYQWYGAARWNIAKGVYEAGLISSISHNNVFAAIQIATDLATCYYAAKRYRDCFLAAENTLPVATAVNANVTPRILSLMHLALIGMQAPDLLNEFLEIARKTPFEPDDRILEEVSDIYTYIGDTDGLRLLQQHWKMLIDPMRQDTEAEERPRDNNHNPSSTSARTDMLSRVSESNPQFTFTSPLMSHTTRFERDGRLAFELVKDGDVRNYWLFDPNRYPGARISQYVHFGGPDEVVVYSLYDPTTNRLVPMDVAGIANTPHPLFGMWNWVDIVGMGKTTFRVRKEIDRPNSAPQLTVFAGDESGFSEEGWRLEGEPWKMNFLVTGPEGPLVAVRQRPSVLEIEVGRAYDEAMALAMVTGMTLVTRSMFNLEDNEDDFDDEVDLYDDEDDFEDDEDYPNLDHPF